jgi:NADH-quinone oxidoreductase subunit H
MPLVLSAVVVVMMAGSLSLGEIVRSQSGYAGGVLARWYVFTPWGLAGFILFMIAATAEANRAPFDIPEGESEIIAGHMVEYSGFKYALFFMGEYLGMFAASGLAITLFLGGFQPLLPFLDWFPSWGWFFAKLLVLVGLFIWLRGTLPRLRADQLMNLAWKWMLPMALINVAVAGLWRYSASWHVPGALVARWAAGAALLLLPGLWLSRNWRARVKPRVYRYADA